jgi:hypothetical protein
MAALSGAAAGLGLGEIVQQSALGEPFRVTIPVIVNPEDLAGDELAPECFRLVAAESQGGAEIPRIAYGRATLARNAQGVFVIVTSSAVTNDPAMSFTVQAGCRLRIQHQYTVLLDPPIIREPLADASLPDRPTSVRSGAPPRAGVPAHRGEAAPTRSSSRPRSSAPKAPAQASAALAAPRPATKSPAPPASSAAKASEESKPKLRVSRSSEDQSAQGASDIARGKSDDEIRRDVEAETVVLQRRIAELSATLERMQAELREATAARESAERTAANQPPRPPVWEPGPWIVALLLVLIGAVLVLALMVARSRRMPSFAQLDAPTISGGETLDTERAERAVDDRIKSSDRSPATAATALTTEENEAREVRRVSSAALADEEAFDDDLLRYAEQRSTYTVLEREHPRIVASVVRDWGKPKVIGYLREILVSPRRTSTGFSREAVSDLMLLQGIAMEHAGYGPDDNPWQIQLGERRRSEA